MGADINNTEDEDGNTPLISAVLNEDLEMVRKLLFYNADVMAKNKDGLNVFEVIECLERETGEKFSKIIMSLLTNSKNTSN